MSLNEESSICRLCLSENRSLIYIYKSDNLGIVPADIISELIQLEVINSNAYPQHACLECMGKLKEFKEFKEMCIISKELLDKAYVAKCLSIKGAGSEEIPKQNGICEDEETLRTLEVIAANATLLEPKKESEECPVGDDRDSDDNLSCISEWEEIPINPTSNPPNEGQNSDGYSANESADEPTNDDSGDDRKSNVAECNDVSVNPPPVSLKEEQSATEGSTEPSNGHRSNLAMEKYGEIPEYVPQDPINDSVLSDSRVYNLRQWKQMCDAFKCNECGLSFASREEITTHMSIHVDRRTEGLVKKRLNGDINSKDYKKRNSRQKKEHIPKVYWCDICGKILSSEHSLLTHKAMHADEVVRSFGCNECYRMFAKLPQLSIHVRSHRGALPFPCPVCNVRFSVKCDLHNHFKTLHIDSKEATYNCADCGFLNADIQGVELTVKESGDSEKESEECPVGAESYSDDNLSCISEWEEVTIDPTSNPPNEGQNSDGYSANESADEPTNNDSGDDRMSNVEESEEVSISPAPVSLEKKQSVTDGSTEQINGHRSNLTIEKEAEIPENVVHDPINDSVLSDSRGYNLHQQKQMCDAFKCNECGLSFASREEITTHMSIHVDIGPEGLVKKRLNGDIDSKDYIEHSSQRKRQKIKHEREVVRSFGCNECYRLFAKLPELIVHVRSHRGALPFPCPICNVRLSVKCDLHNHFKTLHIDSKEVTYNCADCGFLNADIQGVETSVKESGDAEEITDCSTPGNPEEAEVTENGLQDPINDSVLLGSQTHRPHQREQLSDALKCNRCGLFVNKKELLNHMLAHVGIGSEAIRKKKFSCKFCSKSYRSSDWLRKHLRNVHTLKVHCCEVCGEKFESELDLKIHASTHEFEKSGSLCCSICLQTFVQLNDLCVHMRRHKGALPFFCPVCNVRFSLKCELHEHYKNSHNNTKDIVYDCVDCSLMNRTTNSGGDVPDSSDANTLNAVAETTERSTPCNPEEAEVTENGLQDPINDSELLDSQTYHLSQREQLSDTFKCNECGLSFDSKEEIATHMWIHVDKGSDAILRKKFRCTFCSKSYGFSNSLARHLRNIHTPKVHCCDACGEKFESELYLKIHASTHEFEKSGSLCCSICLQTFLQLQDLRVHMRRHKGVLPFFCPVCNVRFSLKCELHEHYKNSHNNTKDVVYNCADCSLMNRTTNSGGIVPDSSYPVTSNAVTVSTLTDKY